MKFWVRRFYSGFCTYEIKADNEEQAYEKTKEMHITDDILGTLESWDECDEVELAN